MLGAIVGDIVGSVHEGRGTKTKDFPLFVPESTFTDDTVLTLAVAEWLRTQEPLPELLKAFARQYPRRGYGGMFLRWVHSPSTRAYGSFGNGAAMRVSPVAYACGTVEEVRRLADRSARATHDHPEGIRGAQAAAVAVFLARTGREKDDIRKTIEREFGYDLGGSLDEIRPGYAFDDTCQGTVPVAILAFLESNSFEDAIRNAVSLGGDADTLACIAGAIAAPHYGGVPDEIAREAESRLDEGLRRTLRAFREFVARRGVALV